MSNYLFAPKDVCKITYYEINMYIVFYTVVADNRSLGMEVSWLLMDWTFLVSFSMFPMVMYFLARVSKSKSKKTLFQVGTVKQIKH